MGGWLGGWNARAGLALWQGGRGAEAGSTLWGQALTGGREMFCTCRQHGLAAPLPLV
jgi:hypothetical protein